MPYHEFLWTESIIEHLAEHGVTPAEFEAVVRDPLYDDVRRSSGLPAAVGYADGGRLLFCVYRPIDELFVEPVTAYEIED